MNLNLPTDPQQIADDLARMMGYIAENGSADSDWWIEPTSRKRFMQMDCWEPHLLYEDCRIVEDWLESEDCGFEFAFTVQRITRKPILRSTALQRCQAAWLVGKEKGLIP